ncbi:hypothetical protein JCM19237_3617 [Photobacterium aphoticum]|uniref:Uncharacterized protein n=1 Tax=Photobacterium aphoticum TaxID=754436 RepID=A0A090QTR1_9GAMM|nr:hypothetical protein JCM19237_3617 [Photobacterium aphoticum]
MTQAQRTCFISSSPKQPGSAHATPSVGMGFVQPEDGTARFSVRDIAIALLL